MLARRLRLLVLSVVILCSFGLFTVVRSLEQAILQSSHAGQISKLVLVYTKTAEMGIISLIDIMRALPNSEVILISQFSPESKEFQQFSQSLTRDGLGFDQAGKPRIRFVQDARSYGPWPRDQALIDKTENMWVSASDQHNLKGTFSSLDASFGIQNIRSPVAFVGANLLVSGERVLCPEVVDTTGLSKVFRGPFFLLPSERAGTRFHLDLLVMPLSDNVIAVGDDSLARAVLTDLTVAERSKLLARWTAEFAVSAQNLRLERNGFKLSLRSLPRPGLILWSQLKGKLSAIRGLSAPGAFQRAVEREPELTIDDEIARSLAKKGFRVIRVPFWAATVGVSENRKQDGLPMICYPNSLVWEDGILMPVYGIERLDRLARTRIQEAAQKRVYSVRGGAILGYSSSGPHCLTVEFREQ